MITFITKYVCNFITICMLRSTILYVCWNWIIISELNLPNLSFALCFIFVSLILILFRNPQLSSILNIVSATHNILLFDQTMKLLTVNNLQDIQNSKNKHDNVDKQS